MHKFSSTLLQCIAVSCTVAGLSACSDIERAWNLMTGVGEIGTLADGTGRPQIRLDEGTTVPTMSGEYPLIPKPLPALPMEDHPYLLDEYASAGVHGDSYNSSVMVSGVRNGIVTLRDKVPAASAAAN